jgi:hypothetical protein
MPQKINDKAGIRETFAALPDLKKVHILEDGRHFFDEAHAKSANGFTRKVEGKKETVTPKEVKYKSYGPDASELQDEAAK